MSNASAVWLACPKQNPYASLRLFCVPYAGGSAPVFRSWSDGLPSRAEVWAIQLPGRGSRFRETPYTQLAPLMDALGEAIFEYLDRPFAFFGHSMGALVSFELTRWLRRENKPLPFHLFISACGAPHLVNHDQPLAHLSDSEFLHQLRKLNGTPPQILEQKELVDLLLPTLRADFAAFESYVFTPEPPLELPITVFGGLDDARISLSLLQAWQIHTKGAFNVKLLPGDHFFIHSAQSLLLRSIAQALIS